MRNLYTSLPLVFLICVQSQSSLAYPLPVSRYESDGSLFVESTSIAKRGNDVFLTYVENFNQAQSYGELSYRSKTTNVRINCSGRRVFALSESFYSDPDRSGKLLGAFPLSDQFGSYAEHGSWVSELVNIGCQLR
ncbi:MAG: surface-adhesin E family protein [Polynucleobacter sp.]